MADNDVEIKVKVNSETGALDVLSSKLGSLGQVAGGILSAFGIEASGKAVLKFFQDSITAAENEALAMKRLSSVYGDSSKAIKEWAESLQKVTSFSSDVAISTFEKLARASTDVTQAQAASKLAMDISIGSGIELSRVTEVLFNLINGQVRAVKSAHDEFGGLIKIYGTAQSALDNLAKKYDGAAEKEQGFSKETKTLANEWSDFEKHIGEVIIPTLTKLVATMNSMISPSKANEGIQKALDEHMPKPPSDEEWAKVYSSIGLQFKKVQDKIPPIKVRVEVAMDEWTRSLNQAKQEWDQMHDQMILKKVTTTAILKKHTQEWVDSEVKSIEFVRDLSKQAVEEFVTGFSGAIAQTIVEGKEFGESFVNIIQKVIEMIIQAILQMIIFRSLATAFGGPIGGFVGWGMAPAHGAAGSPSSPKMPMMGVSPFTQNPSSMRTVASLNRLATSWNGGKPYAY